MKAIISLISERNIVFHVVELAGRLLGRAALRVVARSATASAGLFARSCARSRLLARRAAAFAPAEHLHGVAANLGRVAVLAGLLVLPLAGAKLSLDVHLRALLQVLARD